MTFDIFQFLATMLEVLSECQKEGSTLTARQQFEHKPLVRIFARRALRQQARRQGASRRQCRKFADEHLEEAIDVLKVEVQNFNW